MDFNLYEIISGYVNLPVAAVCFMFGWLLKNVFPSFNSKLIPVALIPVGIVGVLWVNAWAFTPETVMIGICSTALAVYLHTTGKHILEFVKPVQ